MRVRVWLVVCVSLLLALPVTAAPAAQSCPPAGYTPQLTAGIWGAVVSGDAHNLRDMPGLSGRRVARMAADDVFRVLDGPRCADGYVWWQVDYAGLSGWTAEGGPESGDPWLGGLPQPLAAPPVEVVEGCIRPPDDVTRVQIGYALLNRRTLAMLDVAAERYRAAGGTLRLRDQIMQGSYNPGGVSASFGTHDGGGAIDLSVREPQTRNVLAAEIPLLLRVLRETGFAAWLRETDELYKGSPVHIHAIAIGDPELSEAARGQIDGTFGYLRGYDGLPQTDGIPKADRWGEPVICAWMEAAGFTDLREDRIRP